MTPVWERETVEMRERNRWGSGVGWKGWCSIDFSVSLWPAGLSFSYLSPVCEPPLITLGDSLSSPSSFPLQSNSHKVVFVNHLWITNCSLLLISFFFTAVKIVKSVVLYFICQLIFIIIYHVTYVSGTCQRSVGPPILPFLGLSWSSSFWPPAVIGHPAVNTTSTTITIFIIDPQPLNRLCSFLPAVTE